MPLSVSAGLLTRLDAAAVDGLDVAWLCEITFPAPVGVKYYGTRAVTVGGNTYVNKLLAVPTVPKQADLSALRFDALNDALTLRLRNTYEDENGDYDAERVQELMHQAGLGGALVRVGFVDTRVLTAGTDIKWDHLYRVDRLDYDEREVQLYCLDAMLHPGEREIGEGLSDGDWPKAPTSSYGQVRGPVFGKVEGLPLVPVEVGLEATLDNEIDEQSGTFDLQGSADLSLWPSSGYVEVEDEIVRYLVLDQTNRVLGSTASPCLRGQGFPLTTAAAHNNGAMVTEYYSGREMTLSGAITNSATVLVLASGQYFPNSGIVKIDSESIRYTGRSTNTLTGLTRGVAAPTLAKVHNSGVAVRLIPTNPTTGQPRYRFVVAEGVVSAVSNLRVIDQNGNDQSYTGGAAVVSQVTTASGKVVSVVDLPARARLESYEGASAQIPQDLLTSYDNTKAAVIISGSTTAPDPLSFYYWRPGPSMSSAVRNQMAWVIIPAYSGEAALLSYVSATTRFFDVIVNMHWDGGLNSPRRKYGRFKDARVKVRYQWDRYGSRWTGIQVRKDGVELKAFTLLCPTGPSISSGSISGTQDLLKTRWNTNPSTKRVRLASFSNAVRGAFDAYAKWCYPEDVPPTAARPRHQYVLDGDQRSFLCGDFSVAGPGNHPDSFFGTFDLALFSSDAFPDATSQDKIVAFKLTVANPNPAYGINTGVSSGAFRTYSVRKTTATDDGNPGSGSRTYNIGWSLARGANGMQVITLTPSTPLTWAQVQCVEVRVPMYTGSVGTVLAVVDVDIVYYAAVEGQTVTTTVDGSFFQVSSSGGQIPTQVLEAQLSIGSVAKSWAKANNKDPWEFFSQPAPQGTTGGLELQVYTDLTGDPALFSIGDLVLEMEYHPSTAVYDGEVVADVDGRTGTPVGGGGTVVLEHPVDVLASLIDSSEFFGMGSYRDSASFVTARANTAVSKTKVARAVTETVSLRQLASELCAESLLLMLFDAAKIYAKVRTAVPSAGDSVATIGDQADPAKMLVRQAGLKVSNRLEEYYNSLGYYYRRNYRTGDFRTVLEVADVAAQSGAMGKRRQTPNLEWHQSARGYAGGFAEQKSAVQAVADYGMAVASTVWDYHDVEVSGAIGERLQRYDTMLVTKTRAGLSSAVGRVVRVDRRQGPYRYGVGLQMLPGGLAPYWYVTDAMKVLITQGGTQMEFFIQGARVMVVTSAGVVRTKYGITTNAAGGVVVPSTLSSLLGVPPLEMLSYNSPAQTGVALWRWRGDAPYAGKYEHLLQVRDTSSITLFNYLPPGGGAGTVRNLRTNAGLPVVSGSNGLTDTGNALTTGELRFFVAGKMVARIDNTEFAINGALVQDPNL